MTWWVEPKKDGSGTLIKYGTGNLGRKGVHWEGDFTVGRWHQLGMHIHWSEDPARGNVKLWWDGVVVLDKKVQTKGPQASTSPSRVSIATRTPSRSTPSISTTSSAPPHSRRSRFNDRTRRIRSDGETGLPGDGRIVIKTLLWQGLPDLATERLVVAGSPDLATEDVLLWQGLPTLPPSVLLWQGLPTLPPNRPKVSNPKSERRPAVPTTAGS